MRSVRTRWRLSLRAAEAVKARLMDGVVMVSAFMAITLLRRKSLWVLLMIHRQAMPHLEPRLTCLDEFSG